MRNGILIFSICLIVVCSAGCSCLKKTALNVIEAPKIIWGSSTRALEQARDRAVSRSFECRFEECFDAVIKMTSAEAVAILSPQEETEKETAEGKNDTGMGLVGSSGDT